MSALPDGWKMARLEDVAAWSSGGTPKARTSAYYGGNIPWAVIGDLNDAVVTTTAGTITEAGLANSSAKWVPRDSVLVAMYGSIGKLGISGTPLATNQAIAAARPNRSVVEMRYLFYYLMSQRSALSRAGKGAAQQNIGQGILKAWTIPLPPLAEQGRIVEVLEEHLSRLDTADSLLQSSSRRSAVLDESAIVQILGIGSRTQSIVEDDLPMLPAGWRWSTLSDVAEVVGGVTKDAKKEGTPGLVEVPYLRVANVQRGRLDLTNIATIRVAPAKAAALKLRAGDILMNEGGDRDKLARGWIWEDQIPGCIHQNHVFRARSLGEVRPEWLAWCANSYGSRWAQRHGRQSVNLASISLRMIKTMPIPVPPLTVQDERLRLLQSPIDAVSRVRRDIDIARKRSEALRRSLLTAAFSGKLTGSSSDTERIEELAEVDAR